MFIDINGARLRYSIAGEQNEQTIILLHGGRGFGTHGGGFRAHSPLADRYRVIGYDMRGHGQSSLTPPYTFDQLVDDLEQLRRTLGRDRPMILQDGSFGGMIALSYAVKYPQGLSHLILRGTSPSWRYENELLANYEARISKAPMATRKMQEKLFSTGIVDDNEFRLIKFALAPMYIEDGQKVDMDAILEDSRRGVYHAEVHNHLMAEHYDVVDRLPNIQVPTLILCGEHDWLCPPSHSRLIASRIPGARLVIVPNANHAVPADVANREIRKFLLDHPGLSLSRESGQ
ncbi:MAG: proline-specific peptidase [Candidatus Handelsmanbacteria bacterium RIFCSPLOWO2_12_FULL_64_10]|uniref:Proline-specific peptidase n=1 Tax=Handelsmanbacteria sp. (strain RIFCSPLOWO2_12_FULL_64_10) TaxID=1817868 RepID=A0A1F6C9N7_HANXR|nr:MAG: proline-specific peptidase [Candidatus Handelsmanbacteria bacterium RIFCSPLOWO2_12_FULL_64_10]